MELEVLSENFTSCYDLLSVWAQVIDTFPKATAIIIMFKIFGIVGDVLFGYELITMMESYSHPDVTNYREIMLVSFLLGVPRILHCPIIIFGYGIFPTREYKEVYLDENDKFSHIFKALWYGSLFYGEEYLEKLYVSTFDIKLGGIYFIVLLIDSMLVFYVVLLQSYVLPTDKKEPTMSAISHYFLIIWFVISSFYGLLQNWYCWYKLTSKISFERYIEDIDKVEKKFQHRFQQNIEMTSSDRNTTYPNIKQDSYKESDSHDDNDDEEKHEHVVMINDVVSNRNHSNSEVSNIHKTFCEIWSFCLCTIFLNGFSWLMLTFACCGGFGFVILFTIWLEWNSSSRE
mmetsp:Transcript_57758/g.52043  ORF Transcript_57758/g.52043 Transcript_57758/m.52043 type:complete len:344 (+) Transcript_57758:87-1118(+)